MLINYDVTQNFIACYIVKRLKLKSTLVDHVNIEMSNEDSVLSNQMLLSETVVLRGQELDVYLIVFDMSNFDMILDMDFLSKYKGKIDYIKKNVQFHLDYGEKFTFDRGHVLSMMINNVKVRKNVE